MEWSFSETVLAPAELCSEMAHFIPLAQARDLSATCHPAVCQTSDGLDDALKSDPTSPGAE